MGGDLGNLGEVADRGLLTSSDLGERLPFGVGYFGLLRAWCCEALKMSDEFSELELSVQARRIMRLCLRAATRDRKWEDVLRDLAADDDES
jgi:hypothetical protein